MFLKKITKIKGLGRFRNASVKGGEYGRLTVFYAGNGHGKTTLCAVLRSLQCNDPNHILERKTLGGTDTPDIQLLLDQGPARFNTGTWSLTSPDIHIFDGHFVLENVHTGTEVDTEQRRNFYRVVIGPQGVALALNLDALDAAATRTQTDLTAQRKLIEQHVPKGITLEQFIPLALPPDADQQLSNLQSRLKAANDAVAIAGRLLPNLPQLPILPTGLEDVLEATISGMSADAMRRLQSQIQKHSMEQHGERWIAFGLDHMKDNDCPFCGQSIAANPLIAAYAGYFSEAYKNHKQAITDLRAKIDTEFSEARIVKFAEAFRALEREVEYWKNYVAINLKLPAALATVETSLATLRAATLARIDAKILAPLEPIPPDHAYTAARVAWDEIRRDIVEATHHWNTESVPLIATVKAAAASADKTAIEREIAQLTTSKIRHGGLVTPLVVEYNRLSTEKDKLTAERAQQKKALDAYDETILKDYETSINRYLTLFGAGFKLIGAKKNYVGKAPQSIYGLQFGTATLDVAAKPQPGKPSFRTTMSAGDKSTLALTFFLAQLDHDPDLSNKLVVFDDPFTSLDDYRREVTAKTIVRCASRAAQVLVMSHDKHFLKTIQDRMPTGKPETFQLSLSRNNSSIEPWDLDREVKEGYLQDHMRLQEFDQGVTNDAQAMRTLMRPLLEKYIRYRFPNQIPDGEWLGDMIAIVRTGTDHPLKDVLADLEDINDYTAPFHHDPNSPFNAGEVATYVRRTLDIVGGC
ncbi:MAG: AAA family ATPase [Hyphomicrobium sp.]